MQGGPMIKPTVNLSIFGVDKIEEEKGISCIICHEGYSIKPAEILGIYVYSKMYKTRPTNEILEKKKSLSTHIKTNVYSTVTHFTLIHYSCHLNAAKAEKNLKQPKAEWDGATIRNSHTKV